MKNTANRFLLALSVLAGMCASSCNSGGNGRRDAVAPGPDALAPDGSAIPVADAPSQGADAAPPDAGGPADSSAADAHAAADGRATDTPASVDEALADARGSADGVPAEAGLATDAPAADAVVECVVPVTLTFGYEGGNGLYRDVNTLDPPATLTVTRIPNGGRAGDAGVTSCSQALPACGTAGAVTAATLLADLAEPDVQAVFAAATSPFYGVDMRPVDGPAYSVARSDGHSILVGAPCPASDAGSCLAIPAGVQRLVDDLQSLASAARAAPACQGL